MNENRCVCCGEIIPEGTQVCNMCQEEAERMKIRKERYHMPWWAIVLIILFVVWVIKTA